MGDKCGKRTQEKERMKVRDGKENNEIDEIVDS